MLNQTKYVSTEFTQEIIWIQHEISMKFSVSVFKILQDSVVTKYTRKIIYRSWNIATFPESWISNAARYQN